MIRTDVDALFDDESRGRVRAYACGCVVGGVSVVVRKVGVG